MIHTRPEGELTLPASLAPAGERSWWWVELGLPIPYLLISIRQTTEQGEFETTLLTSRVDDLLHIASNEAPSLRIRQVQLLSPHYMNGTEDYQFAAVLQIWRCDDGREDVVFVLLDGSRQNYFTSSEPPEMDELSLAYSRNKAD